jgi:chromosome partitioning protein
MPVFALVGNKGGAGKTTLAVNLAAGMARGRRTVLVDADPQESSMHWRAFAPADSPLAVHKATADLDRQVDDLLSEFELVIIDCPPSALSPETVAALGVANLALIPVQPSPVDLWAALRVEEVIEEASSRNPGLRALVVINQLEARTTLSRIMGSALAEVQLPLAETVIKRRAVYRNSAIEGKSVFEAGSRGAAAAAELEQLIEEVSGHYEQH